MDLLKEHSVNVASYGIAAAFAAWVLEGLGADVSHESALDADGVGCWLAEGAKHTDSPTAAGPEKDVVIIDAPVSAASKRIVEGMATGRRVIWLTPLGINNAFEEDPATDMVLQAAGGWMYSSGDADREPLSAPGNMVEYVGGQFAVIEALALTLTDGATEPGLTIVSLAECAVATTVYDLINFQYFGAVRGRAGPRYNAAQPTITSLACKDGHVGIHAALHHQWLRICDLIEHPELVSDPRFRSPSARAANVEQLDPYIAEWLASRTRADAYHALQAAGIPASMHPTFDEVLASPQLAARDAWTSVAHSSGREVIVPRPAFRQPLVSKKKRSEPRRRGPWLGDGPRVVDISAGWAGPLVSHVLSFYGADVIKVEGPDRFDWWRGSRPPGDDPALQLHERSHVFNGVNRGKRGVTIDITDEAGRELFLDLVRDADLVVENFGIDVLAKLGVDFKWLSEVNPELVMVRLPAFGSGGPESDYAAFGITIEGMAGLTAMTGYEGGQPSMTSVALGDPVSGLNGTIATLAALLARRVDGHGRLLEISQLEGFLPLVAGQLIEAQVANEQPALIGNRRLASDPSGVARCAGDDNWVAFEVRTDAERAALRSRLGLKSADVDDHEALADAISVWSRDLPREVVLEGMRGAGVACAPVNSPADLIAAEPFASNDFFEGLEREVVGFHLYPGLPVLRDGARMSPKRPAPMLGGHNEEVLGLLPEQR